jgi:hypothetical protein
VSSPNEYILSQHPQGSELWLSDRVGKVTGSRVSALYAKIKTGEAAARRDYRMELAIERLTGTPAAQGFVSADMQWGTAQEPFARMAWEAETGCFVQEAGFAYLPDLPVGCSVDGFIGSGDDLGIFESKCPKSTTHWGYIEADVIPADYLPQIIHNAWVTDAKFAIFVSFDPRMPLNLQLFHKRLEITDAMKNDHERVVMDFLKELDQLEAKMRSR